MTSSRAIRAIVGGRVQGVGFRDATRRRAQELELMGWVRNEPGGDVRVHAEGDTEAVARLLDFLSDGPPLAEVGEVVVDDVKVEGHEQFAIRGVSAGAFLVEEHEGASARFMLSLEVDGELRSWALPKAPSLDPAVKRFAIELERRALPRAHERESESRAQELDSGTQDPKSRGQDSTSRSQAATTTSLITRKGRDGDEDSTSRSQAATTTSRVWDRGVYEQGGRVPWPQAIDRGHAVFVLHGEKLRGGFALQRTRSGTKPQWLLVKRRDDYARSGEGAGRI